MTEKAFRLSRAGSQHDLLGLVGFLRLAMDCGPVTDVELATICAWLCGRIRLSRPLRRTDRTPETYGAGKDFTDAAIQHEITMRVARCGGGIEGFEFRSAIRGRATTSLAGRQQSSITWRTIGWQRVESGRAMSTRQATGAVLGAGIDIR